MSAEYDKAWTEALADEFERREIDWDSPRVATKAQADAWGVDLMTAAKITAEAADRGLSPEAYVGQILKNRQSAA